VLAGPRTGAGGREIARNLPALAWQRVSAGDGTKGERRYDWTFVTVHEAAGWAQGLLVRRSLGDDPEHAYCRFHAPSANLRLEDLASVAGKRWRIEQVFQTAKGECGLDHYEVRSWQGWYRHIALAMLAAAALAVLSAQEQKTPKGQVPLSVPELRHLIGKMLWRGWYSLKHLLKWSTWRRKHQLQALQFHYRKRNSILPDRYLQL